jgi:LysR family transcriptional regulator, hydrogen peroxide-inducible genes activator
MEMHQIRYFLAVADELNFTRAATKCNVSQPSLTRAIKLLEDELGGPLFHRERANTHLSELGRTVRPNLMKILAESTEAKRIAQDFRKLNKTILKLGVMCTIGPNQLIDLFTRIRTEHPGIELELTNASARELNDQLLAGTLEVAIFCLPADEEDERLQHTPLFRERMMIVVNPDHPFAAMDGVAVKDLDGKSYLNRANCEFRGYAGDLFREQGVSCMTVYRSDRDDWIMAMVVAGLGFALMPEGCLTYPGVVARPLVEPEFWREVNLVTVRGRPHSPAVGLLAREARRAQWPGARTPTAGRDKRVTLSADTAGVAAGARGQALAS